MDNSEITKSILIIKAQPKSLYAVENFLRNRDWQIHSTTGLKEALTYLVAKKPSFILITVDHANKKVRTLPKLISSAFPIRVMVFSESGSATSYKLLMDSGCENRVSPPITGPAVERMINKMLREEEEEKYRKELAPESAEISHKQGKPSTQIFSSGGKPAPSFKSEMTSGSTKGSGFADFNPSSAAEILRQLAEAKDEDEKDSPDITQEGAANRGPAYAGSATDPFERAGPGVMQSGNQSGQAHEGRQGKSDSPLLQGEAGEAESDEMSARTSDAKAASLFARGGKAPEAKDLGSVQGSVGESKHANQDDPDFLGNRKGGLQGPGEGKERDDLILKGKGGFAKEDNVFVRGTEAALEESVSVGTHEGPIKKIEETSRVACLTIESPRFSGYLVAALGKNRRMDSKFIDLIKERLGKFLKQNGEPLKEGNSAMDLSIQNVPFEDWAIEYADFLKKSVHEGEEIAMAFFPFANPTAQLGSSEDVQMGSVKMEELEGDVGVDFNLYIYLPSNKKYVLYTPRGSKFYGAQKGRLSGMGVTHMHVKKEELQGVSRYRAQNYLNSKIEEFQRRSAAIKAS